MVGIWLDLCGQVVFEILGILDQAVKAHTEISFELARK